MLFYTHLAFGLLVGLWLMPSQVIFVMLGALIPDVDDPHSKINNKLGVTKVIGYLFKHRGFCHTLWFGLIVFVLLSWVIPAYSGAILLGFVSHLVLDGLTRAGVNFLAPLEKFSLRGFIETGSVAENMVFMGLVVLIVMKII